jgi:hypothetical protein
LEFLSSSRGCRCLKIALWELLAMYWPKQTLWRKCYLYFVPFFFLSPSGTKDKYLPRVIFIYPPSYSAFYLCARIPGIHNLKGGKVDFGSQFERFQFMVSWLHCFGACRASRQRTCGGLNKAVYLMSSGSREREGGMGSQYLF